MEINLNGDAAITIMVVAVALIVGTCIGLSSISYHNNEKEYIKYGYEQTVGPNNRTLWTKAQQPAK